ncbi:MAG: hypothetical protein J5736_04960 [Bacilli bacterium]|nr:hypothetical protein [Bacilli bacterium]
MKKAIGLRFVPYDESKHIKSHFLGAPLAIPSMQGEFADQVFFLGMIHLPEIATLDHDNLLPHEGYLYFFLDSSTTTRHMKPIVRYVKEEPTLIIDDFNSRPALKDIWGIQKAHGIEFEEVDVDSDGCKLLGVPCDWNYQDPPKSPLLLSISHYDEELDFCPELDGYTYIFFGPKGKEFEEAYGFYEYS